MEEVINKNRGTVIDVRTRQEFGGAHVAGSVNIPLNEVPASLKELNNMEKPLIICCASGMRSAQAAEYLQGHNIECFNGGSWLEVNYIKSKNLQI